ncbi:MAG: hypothetical protein JJ974_12405 [Phycisphaerales bacterium]|nr:hypothetical protein [Phycisphaerales bacterium]
MNEQPVVIPEEREDELALGVDEARAASINWLGVKKEEAVEGEAELSETDQAAQTLVVGDSFEATESVPEDSVQAVEQAVQQIEAIETAEFDLQEVEEAVNELAEEVVDAVSEPLIDASRQVVEGIDAVLDDVASTVVMPEEAVGAEQIEGAAETVEQQVAEATVQQDPVQEQATEGAVEQATERVTGQAARKTADRVVGTLGILSDREVAATRIKKALKVDPHKANAPIVGKGLEILTVRPRYTSAVRLSAIPKNPVVVMWFNGTGKVARAEFVRDGRVVYSSGVLGVDEPLLNAIYQWRAKGAQIDGLDPKDPDDLVEVTIKILFRPERSGSTD